MTDRSAAADLVIDGGDRTCIALLIELRNRIQHDGFHGAVVHLTASDPAAPLDLPAWCHLTGHTYLGPVPGQLPTTYAMRVNGNARNTQPRKPWHPTNPPS